ncbi:hypothetical protein DX928_18600 [Bacillus swezeyi]|uniref:Uncharacterized protein n=1 Tax=Bacillus swezeyi TaxID=1925020 RepID=A0A5M8RLM6_9BACI|nr:hypothetical protein DX927_21130 [Bacillus swezeyi]KAA6473878.1 hypothetical protein DX928_18600 [Bacillus swezeyi]
MGILQANRHPNLVCIFREQPKLFTSEERKVAFMQNKINLRKRWIGQMRPYFLFLKNALSPDPDQQKQRVFITDWMKSL